MDQTASSWVDVVTDAPVSLRPLAPACRRCSEPALPDRSYCALHLAAEVERAARRRTELRADRRCIVCGKRSKQRSRCAVCRKARRKRRGAASSGVRTAERGVRTESAIAPADLYAAKRARVAARTAVAYEAAGDSYGGGTRARYRGRDKGPPTVAETDDQDFFALDREVALGRATTERWHTEETQALPAIQRRAIAAEAIGHLDLAERFIEQIRTRAARRLK